MSAMTIYTHSSYYANMNKDEQSMAQVLDMNIIKWKHMIHFSNSETLPKKKNIKRYKIWCVFKYGNQIKKDKRWFFYEDRNKLVTDKPAPWLLESTLPAVHRSGLLYQMMVKYANFDIHQRFGIRTTNHQSIAPLTKVWSRNAWMTCTSSTEWI